MLVLVLVLDDVSMPGIDDENADEHALRRSRLFFAAKSAKKRRLLPNTD